MSLIRYFGNKVSNSWLSNRCLLFCYFQQAMFIVCAFAISMFKSLSGVQLMRCHGPGLSMPAEHVTDRCGWSSLFTVAETLGKANATEVAYPGVGRSEGKDQRSFLIYPYIPVL